MSTTGGWHQLCCLIMVHIGEANAERLAVRLTMLQAFNCSTLWISKITSAMKTEGCWPVTFPRRILAKHCETIIINHPYVDGEIGGWLKICFMNITKYRRIHNPSCYWISSQVGCHKSFITNIMST